MTAPRISDTYRKETLHPAGHGYGRQNIGGAWIGARVGPVRSVIVHTTNNPNKGTKIWNEATFIRDSKDVSCHDLISKDGSIYQILPANMVAWHAGVTIDGFANSRSYGIEVHCSVGETPTQAQRDSLEWRIRQLITTYRIKVADIDTHRAVAVPRGRKSDPEGWSDADFYAWRDALFTPAEPDWSKEWGDAFHYFHESGIAQAWRDAWRLGNELGTAVSDEMSISGGVVRIFRDGYITWDAQRGTTVRRWV